MGKRLDDVHVVREKFIQENEQEIAKLKKLLEEKEINAK